jgi:predicted lipoprotein with Yx(FWY)xxD motif
MKLISTALILAICTGSVAQAITVKEGDIAGKTNLVAVADASVKGQNETILTDSNGITLYTFERDTANVSNCSGGCLSEWPPQHVPNGVTVQAPFATIKGNDGQTQLTLNGLPLYHYDDDQKPGDTFGEYTGWDVIVIQN